MREALNKLPHEKDLPEHSIQNFGCSVFIL